ncbi:nibrin [Planococcus citri]|uniref:nibrin n=1 Tax=Planococcus citri TaxID=170843 RepID=UPI0031F9C6B6
MIILRSERGEIYNLSTKPKHVVGRNASLELEGDKSVSRQHAVIHVSVKNKKIQIKLEDLDSKYGTYVNDMNREIPKNTMTALKIGDKIKFGQQWNTWTIMQSEMVVCVSMLNPDQKQLLARLLKPMKASLVSEWSDECSHLTMIEFLCTMKVIQALGRVKPVVSLEYWSKLAEVLNSTNEKPLPDCDDFVPPIAEPALQNASMNLKMQNSRRKLFNNMQFVVCSAAQYDKISSMVSHSGGTVVDGSKTVFKEEQLKSGKIVVLESDTNNVRSRNLAQLMKILQALKHRRITEAEIGLSMMTISTEVHCNPTRRSADISGQSESQLVIKEEEASIYDVEETQELDEQNSTQFFDSDTSKFSLNVNDQRIPSDDDDDIQVVHDTPEDNEPVVQAPPAKRKRNDSSDQSNSKSLKMTDWVIRKPSTKPNLPPREKPTPIELVPKPVKNNIFAFNRDKKPAQSTSDSLFKVPTPSTSSIDRVDSVEKRKRGSVELFSSDSPPAAKKPNIDRKDLFQLPSTSKTTRSGSLILFESDSTDSASQKPTKLKDVTLKTVDHTSNKENTPGPSKKPTSSSFFDLSKKKCKEEAREEESEDMCFDTKDGFNQSVILTVPLVIKPQTQERQSPNTTNGSAVNFKKFRKNNGINRARVISANELVVYTNNMSLNGDAQLTDYSDSD